MGSAKIARTRLRRSEWFVWMLAGTAVVAVIGAAIWAILIV